MHIVVIFISLGNYHIARLEAARQACEKRGWKLTAVQVTDDFLDHPWGETSEQILFPVETLLPRTSKQYDARRDTFSAAADVALEQRLEKLKPDVVFLPGWYFSVALTGLRWCRRSRAVPIVMSESQENDAHRVWWRELYKRWRIGSYKAALVGGKPHKQYLVKLGMSPDAIFYGYDVVGNDFFHPSKISSKPNPLSKPYILAISRFIPKKNLLLVISAYAAYRQLNSQPWDLVLCGDGELHPQIKQQIMDLEIEQFVHLPGFLHQHQLLPYFAHASCFVHASIQEQWGLVVNEAMAAGLPVLVSNRCGCAEDLVIEGVNGFSFDPNDVEALTHLMVKLSSGELDLEAMGQASLRHIQAFSPDYFAQGLVQAVEYALAHRQS
jgi:glycosyltransferase involved in cell wall biosynthesis